MSIYLLICQRKETEDIRETSKKILVSINWYVLSVYGDTNREMEYGNNYVNFPLGNEPRNRRQSSFCALPTPIFLTILTHHILLDKKLFSVKENSM